MDLEISNLGGGRPKHIIAAFTAEPSAENATKSPKFTREIEDFAANIAAAEHICAAAKELI